MKVDSIDIYSIAIVIVIVLGVGFHSVIREIKTLQSTCICQPVTEQGEENVGD